MFASLLAQLRIGPKLLLAPVLVLALLTISSGGAYWAMVRQNDSLETIVEVRAARIKEASDLVAEAQGAHARSYQLLTWISASVSAARVKALEAAIHRRHVALAHRFTYLAGRSAPGGTERRLLEQAAAAHAGYVSAVLEVIELAGGDQSVAANAMVKAEHAFEREATRLAALASHQQKLSEAAARGAAADFQLIRVLMPALVAASILLSLFITMAVRRSLLREVSDIGQSAQDIASGNLTVRARDYGSDEISDTSRTLDASIRTLNHTLKDILVSARSIDSASRDIAMGNVRMSRRAGEQATSLEQTSAAMEQLTATMSQNAGHALAANRLAASASDLALRGGDVVKRLVHTLAAIKGKSHRVVDFIGVIDHLAGRTSTLALNAALEAARAGEHGARFAVVASEVRQLAQQCAVAACEVRALVEQSVAQIEGGSAAAAEAGYSMADIVDSVRQVGDMMSQISEASAEQASGMSDVNCAIVQMDHMTQQNSALVQQAAAAAASLQSQAHSLSQAVATFKLDEGGAPVSAGRAKLRLASKRE